MKFLSVKIGISSNYLSNKTEIIRQIYCKCQNQMFKKMAIKYYFVILSFFQGDHTLSRKKKMSRNHHIVELDA